jgi:vitamin B12 transporter
MRRSLVISFVFCICFHLSLLAQGTSNVRGYVLDPTHAPVPRASIRLLASDQAEIAHTFTDQQGRFAFLEGCSPGCSVEIQLAGFRTKRLPVSSGELAVELALAPVQESLIVSATRLDTPASQIGSTTTSINAKEIADRGLLMVSDLLETVAGIAVTRSGTPGAVTSLFVRGGESDYSKVLLDDIPINEPGGYFEFSNLTTDDLDHIEIVRGPESAIFGSDAMAGVVQLFTRHNTAEVSRPQIEFDLDGGKYGTLHGNANVNGHFHAFDYDSDFSRFQTDNQVLNEAFRDSTAGFNLGYALGARTHLRWITRADQSRAGTPGQTAFAPPITDAFYHKTDGYTGLSLADQTNHFWDQRLTYTYERSRQVSEDLGLDPPYYPSYNGHTSPVEFFDFASDFHNDTRRQHLDYQSDVSLGSGDQHQGRHIFTFAFDWDRETGFIGDRLSGTLPTHALRDDFGGTFQYQTIFGKLFLSNGVRVEGNSSFGEAVIPRSSAAYLLRQSSGTLGTTKLKFNFGLGIKEPSFIESFSPEPAFLGNPHLRPERVRGFDFGVEQRFWSDRGKLELNWFDNRFRDLIEFEAVSFNPFSGSFFNLNATKANGAEIVFETVPCKGVKITSTYTYLNGWITRSSTPTDPLFGVGKGLLRRPRHSGSLGVTWNWRRLNLTSSTVYVGRRPDSDFADLQPPLTSSQSYLNWNLAWTYRINSHLSYFGIIENLLDQSYMEVLGYPALRIAYRTGARVRF